MSRTSPKLIVAVFLASFAALILVSCSQQSMQSPSGPSPVGAGAQQGMSIVIEETLVDNVSTREPGDFSPTADPVVYPPNSSWQPWPPVPVTRVAPGIPLATPPSTHYRLSVRVEPEPVTYSGVPIPVVSCSHTRHTWYYDQKLRTDTGIPVTITERENFFDGHFSSKNTTTVRIDGNSGVDLRTRWCSGFAKPHYAQTRFKGHDANGEPFTLSGPWIRLLTP